MSADVLAKLTLHSREALTSAPAAVIFIITQTDRALISEADLQQVTARLSATRDPVLKPLVRDALARVPDELRRFAASPTTAVAVITAANQALDHQVERSLGLLAKHELTMLGKVLVEAGRGFFSGGKSERRAEQLKALTAELRRPTRAPVEHPSRADPAPAGPRAIDLPGLDDPADAPEDLDAATALRSLRARMDPTPRRLPEDVRAAAQLTLGPSWGTKHTYGPTLLAVDSLLEQGTVCWASVVQANNRIFSPGNTETLPANILYSTDAYYDGRPAVLLGLASKLAMLKSKPEGGHPDLVAMAREVASERGAVLRARVPLSVTNGHAVFFGVCLLQPSHLLGGALRAPVFPVLCSPDQTQQVYVLPHFFLSDELRHVIGRLN